MRTTSKLPPIPSPSHRTRMSGGTVISMFPRMQRISISDSPGPMRADVRSSSAFPMHVNVRNTRGRIHSPSRMTLDHHTVTPLRSGTMPLGRILDTAGRAGRTTQYGGVTTPVKMDKSNSCRVSDDLDCRLRSTDDHLYAFRRGTEKSAGLFRSHGAELQLNA